jgi:hypothetical protein
LLRRIYGEVEPARALGRQDTSIAGIRGREQLARIGMLHPAGDEVVDRQSLDDGTSLHDRHPVAKVRDHCQIVAHENAGHRPLLPDRDQEVQDLGLHGGVESAGRLVEEKHIGLQNDRAGDGNPLPLTARQFMGVAEAKTRSQPNLVEPVGHAAVEVGEAMRCRPSDRIRSTVWRGFSDA